MDLPIRAPVFVHEDWDDDNVYGGPYDDLSADVLPGLTVDRGRDQGRVIGGPRVPRATWTLDNESRIYSTAYSGSPLHGVLLPGHRAEVGRTLGDDDLTMGDAEYEIGDAGGLMGGVADVWLFTGNTEEPVESLRIGERTVQVAAFGLSQRLLDTSISIPYQPSITTGAAMVMALEAAGLVDGADFVVDAEEISGGFELLHWWVDDASAWDVARRIWATAGPPSALYEDVRGVLHFEGRNYRASASRSMLVQQTFSDDATDLFYVDLDYAPSRSSVVNDMAVTIQTRAAKPLQQVWQADGVLTLAGNEVREIRATAAESDDPEPWTGVITPVFGTDYTTGIGGIDLVETEILGPLAVKILLHAGPFSTTVLPTGSNTGIQLRAQPVTETSSVTRSGTIDTTASKAVWGTRRPPQELSSAIWPIISTFDADGLIDAYLLAYQEPRALLTMTAAARTGAILYEIMTREIGDRIHIVDAWSGISLDVTIEAITHRIDALSAHACQMVCERVVELDWGRFDVDLFDVDRFGN